MKGRKAYSLLPLKRTKITTVYRITIEEKDQSLPEKIFYN